VKIEATCKTCRRDVTGDQMIQGGGECPWCGTPFSPDYAVTFVDAVREVQEAGTELERAITALADVGPAISIAEASVLGELRRQLARMERPAVVQP
jgi:hypothetical protein